MASIWSVNIIEFGILFLVRFLLRWFVQDRQNCGLLVVSHLRIFYCFRFASLKTRMTTSISSEALLPFVAWPTDRRTKYLDAHIQEECAQKIWELYLNYSLRKSRFPLNLTDRHTYWETYIHTDGGTLAFIE